MGVLFIISLLVLLAYSAMLLLFGIGWRRVRRASSGEACLRQPKVSLVVCCRNEEQNLPRLFASIAAQSYEHIEVVLCDDSSTDATLVLMEEFARSDVRVKVVRAQGKGKKMALRSAVACATDSLVCCTDADCLLSEHYVMRMAEAYASSEADMLIGAVMLNCDDGVLGSLQALEFLSLQASTIGAVGIGSPIMCNGANLAFTKQLWNKVQGALCDTTPSGDDMFLLHAAKRCGAKVRFVAHREAIVATRGCTTISEFTSQRARWASKCGYYTDWQTIAVAVLVTLSALLMLLWGVASLSVAGAWRALLVCFVLKWVVDTAFLCYVLPYFAQQRLCRYTLLLSLIYPFYVVATLICGFFRPKMWKERKF